MDVIQFKRTSVHLQHVREREAKLLREDHTQQQQTGWLIWLTLCKTSKYDDKKKKKTWNYIGNITEVHRVEKNT